MSRRSQHVADLAIAAVVRLLPDACRARRREEWSADLAGAGTAGVSRAQIVVGALRVAAVVPRTPEAFGISARALAARRLRWASAFIVAAIVLALGAFLGAPNLLAGWAGRLTGGIVVVAIAVCGLVGTGWAMTAVHGALAPRRPAVRWAGMVAVVAAIPIAAVLTLSLLLPLSLIGLLGGAVLLGLAMALPISADIGRRRTRPGLPARLGTRATAAVGAVVVSSAAALATVDLLVWNPMAKVPGLALDEVYRQLAARGEAPLAAAGPVVAWASGWLTLALVFLITAIVGDRGVLRRLDARRIARATIAALAAIGFTQWIAGFGIGMAIADAFATDGGPATSIPAGLVVVGTVAGVIAALRVLPPGSGAVPALHASS